MRIKSTVGEYNFAGQYQQTPAPAGGGMVKEAWFRRYRPDERPASFDQIVQSWDTANKPTELADYSVCTTWGIKGPNFYLLNVLRKKLDFPRPQAGGARTERSLQPDGDSDRGQGVGDPTDPGPHRRRSFARHAIQARRRQDHAPAQPRPRRSRTASSTCPRPPIGSPTICRS